MLWTSEEAEARDREDMPKAVHLEAEPGLGSGSEAGALSSCFRAFVSFSSVGRKTSSRQTGGARVRVTGDPEERGEWPGPRVRLPPHPNPWLGGNCPLPSPALAGGRERGWGGLLFCKANSDSQECACGSPRSPEDTHFNPSISPSSPSLSLNSLSLLLFWLCFP